MTSAPAIIFEDFISLFFPRYCSGCEQGLAKGEDLICTRCMLEMPRSNYHLILENPFYNKLRGRLPVRFVMSLFHFVKAGSVQGVLHALKYRDQPEIGRMLGKVYGNDLLIAGYSDKFDCIIPVPLHPYKKKRRGYNQSEEFGLGMSEVLNIPCEERFLKRMKITETQTKKSRANRWENVKDVFEAGEAGVEGQKILLIDDVVTTGATLEAAGRALLDAGAAELSLACIAATQ
jgi:ComF family protein